MTSASTGSGYPPTSSSLAGRRLRIPSSITITIVQALLGVDVDEHIAHFRKKVVETETAGNWPAQILINLLVRVDRYREALEVSLEYLPGAHASEIACPTAQQLCELAGDFDRLAELARERGDVLTYVAAHLEAAAPAAAAKRR